MAELFPPVETGEKLVSERGPEKKIWHIKKQEHRIIKESGDVSLEYFENEFRPFVNDLKKYMPEYLPKMETSVTGTTSEAKVNIYLTQDMIYGKSLDERQGEIPEGALTQLDDLLEKLGTMYLDTGRAPDFELINVMWGHSQQDKTDRLYAIDFYDFYNDQYLKWHHENIGDFDPVIAKMEWILDFYTNYYDFPKTKSILETLIKQKYVD